MLSRVISAGTLLFVVGMTLGGAIGYFGAMARPLRIEFPGAIYHVMSRGNARQAIFFDDRDYQCLLKDLEDTVVRCGWELFAFTFMPNHFHLFFRTPRPNLSSGMQRLLSTYANQFARRLNSATLRQLAPVFGLARAESISNLTRRIDREIADNAKLRGELTLLESEITAVKTKHKVPMPFSAS